MENIVQESAATMEISASQILRPRRYGAWCLCMGVGLLLLLCACDPDEENDQGLLLSLSLKSGSKKLEFGSQLIVYDLGGKEVRRIDLPYTADQVVAVQANHKVLARTDNGKIYLVDAAQGTTQALDLPEDVQKYNPLPRVDGVGRNGKNWALLDYVEHVDAYLVNLTSGETTDLSALMGAGDSWIDNTSANGDYLVLESTGGLWVMPTNDPQKARRLGDKERSSNGALSDDGKQVLYGQATDTGSEIVIENIDGTGSQVIAAGEKGIRAVFVPGSKKVLLLYPDKVVLHSLGDSTEQELFTYNEAPDRVLFSKDGNKILFSYDGISGKEKWQWYDLNNVTGGLSALKQLDMLNGFTALDFLHVTHDWVTFEDYPVGESVHLTGFDMQTGMVTRTLTFNDKDQFVDASIPSPDTTFSLVSVDPDVYADDNEQLQLLNNKDRTLCMLAEGRYVQGVFSPDSRQILISKAEVTGGVFTSKLSIAETEGTSVREIGDGYGAVWLSP